MTILEEFKESVSEWLGYNIDDYNVNFIYDDGKEDGVPGILVYINGRFICFMTERHALTNAYIIGNVIREFANRKEGER